MCKAIEDVWGESDELEGKDEFVRKRTEAVEKYEVEMRARAGEEVRLSTENSIAMHDWNLLSKSPSLTKGMTVKKD